jgi:serine/threonine protein kinase
MKKNRLFFRMLDIMFTVIQTIFRAIYECFYSFFYGSIISFPESHVSVTYTDATTRQIGEGAFSVVLKVKDINDSKSYAVKKMLLQSPENITMANVEVSSLKRFQHPHIIKLLDVIETTEQNQKLRVMYLLLPFYHHGNLREYLNLILHRTINKPPLQSILRDFLSICDAIRILHQFQPSYVHQDIKPEVILIFHNSFI